MITEHDLLIHVGHQKTATSWLQRHLFVDAEIGFGTPFSRQELRSQIIEKAIVNPIPLAFNVAQCRATFTPRLTQLRAQQLYPVISRERLSGSIFSGGYDSKQNACRLATVFPHAKILLVIREQKSMLLSTYKQLVKHGSQHSIGQLFELDERLVHRIPSFSLKRYEYHRLITHYTHLFGRENVLVLPYELFREQPLAYLQNIVSFCGLLATEQQLRMLPYHKKENKAISAIGIEAKRQLNKWAIQDVELNPSPPLPFSLPNERIKQLVTRMDRRLPWSLRTYFDSRLKVIIGKQTKYYYRESNQRTAHLIDIDLSEYGYEM